MTDLRLADSRSGEASALVGAAPSISVVVASQSDLAALEACLSALSIPETGAAQILVVRSQDGAELDRLKEAYPHVVFLAAPPNSSVQELRSAGMAAARGDIVVVAEDDRGADSEWIASLLAPGEDAGQAEEQETESGGPSGRAVASLRPGDHVVIIGAGPGGLTAAYLLMQEGARVTVLEADDQVGGISQTAQYKGYRFDIGGHRFFTKYPHVERLWHEILGEDFISVPRLSRIFYNNRFFDYPLKAANALRGLGVWNAVLIVLSYLKAHFRPNPVEENFEQWVTNRFGRRLYEIFFKTYTEKVWGIPCTEIRAEWAAQRIQGLSLAKAILSAASLNKRSTKIKTLIHEFQYPRLGPGQMWEACRDRVEERGGRVLMRHRATGIDLEDGRAVAVRVETPEGPRRIEGDHFISTAPIRSLIRALDPAPPEDIRQAAEGLRYRDFLVVALIIDQEDLFPDNWIYIHTPGVKVGRIQNFGNWSRAMVPDPGRSCLGLEYFCFEGDGLWTSSDEELIALATKEIGQLGLADPTLVVDGSVVRMPKAYPIYDAVYRENLDRICHYIDPISNLHPVGRNGMHKYNNQDHSMLTAMMTVWNMLGASHDVWAVNTDFEYHEEQHLDRPQVQAGAPVGAGQVS